MTHVRAKNVLRTVKSEDGTELPLEYEDGEIAVHVSLADNVGMIGENVDTLQLTPAQRRNPAFYTPRPILSFLFGRAWIGYDPHQMRGPSGLAKMAAFFREGDGEKAKLAHWYGDNGILASVRVARGGNRNYVSVADQDVHVFSLPKDEEAVLSYVAPIGNSSVVYPKIIGKQYVYDTTLKEVVPLAYVIKVLGASPSQEQELRESPWRYANALERVMYDTEPPVKNDYKYRVLHEVSA